jgi:hypothetical protein
LLSSLSPDRAQLEQLVAAFSEVAQTRGELSLLNAHIRFMGAVPNQTPGQLKRAILKHSQTARKTVFGNLQHPRLVLEIDSEKPSQLGKKIIRTISETAREQFSRSNPGVIWTHIELISEKDFTVLSSPHNAQAGFFDRIASAALLSEKRSHLGQLVFSGGFFLSKDASAARSSYATAVYNSPACRFGESFIFPGGRRKPLPEGNIA